MKDSRRFEDTMLQLRTSQILQLEQVKILKISLHQKEVELKTKVSLEDVKKRIRQNYNENPLAWWERNQLQAELKVKEGKEYEFVRCRPIPMNIND